MMKVKIWCTIVFGLCTGSVFSQHNQSDFQNQRYDVIHNELSPNGKYVSFKKGYQDSQDSLVVLNTQNPVQIIHETNGVRKSFFTGSNTLFIVKNRGLEIRNLKTQNSLNVNNILQVEYAAERKQVLVISIGEKGNELLILDEKGTVIKKISGIDRFEILPNKEVFVTGKNGETQTVYELHDNELHAIYATADATPDVLTANNRNVVIIEHLAAARNSRVMMVNKTSRRVFPLQNMLSDQIVQVIAVLTDHPDEVYLQIAVAIAASSDKIADIWYGDDNRLETKFYGAEQQHYYLWRPLDQQLEKLDNEDLPEVAFTGNSRYYLKFDPYFLQDYSTYDVPLVMHQYDQTTETTTLVGETSSRVYLNRDGSLLISKKGDDWILHNVETASTERIHLPQSEDVYFSLDNKKIYFEQEGGIVIYDLLTKRLYSIKTVKGFQNTILTGYQTKLLPKYGVYRSGIDTGTPLLIHLTQKMTGESAIAELRDQKITFLVPRTVNKISSVKFDRKNRNLSYVSENLNSPPQLYAGNYLRLKPVYQSNIKDHLIKNVKKEVFQYHNTEGLPISGLLIYPLHFDRTKKYPMIVNVYENQSKYQNTYLRDGYYGRTDGFNVRHFIENDYFVFLPDIIYNKKGTGLSALDCVEQGLKALSSINSIDFTKVGLIGHSHGGYETNFIATHSDKFAAFVSGSGNSDLVKSYFSYNTNFYSPFFWQFEDGQYRIGTPFFQDKEIYLKNSPVQYADQVNSPILLWTGKQDANIHWEQTMEFYLALRRSKKMVVALFYKNEGHSVHDSASKLDLYSKVSDWFAHYLKGADAVWITK
ncbi:alpha/beta hydrolase family protein [Chryseobacterium salivictor]|uniref:Dipeptidyl-peptidase 5 n=1 Tax=Chryseobacterium salivictor TaxID=2547600 RepID=A0A4V1ALD1_9FLAO|nr:prolyl oligopeptidase family serine peptidase [Chryseobacterium salivictor]QBO59344.1 Dipeptidyl-peptidase 5 [Chryseobacterium salivictor]